MKFLLLMWIASFVLFSSDCPSRQTNKATNGEIKNQAVAPDTATANQSPMPNEARSYKNRTKDLEYEIQARLETRKSDKTGAEENYVAVNYTVKNLGSEDYILFNRGHSIENDARRVYVEFQADGIAKLSQKAFAEPKDTVCPNTDAPILPRATPLKAGQSVSERAEITLPLKWKTPFDDCYKKRETPEKVTGFKFCLGVASANKAEISPEGYISEQYLELQKRIRQQQILCGETIKLK